MLNGKKRSREKLHATEEQRRELKPNTLMRKGFFRNVALTSPYSTVLSFLLDFETLIDQGITN